MNQSEEEIRKEQARKRLEARQQRASESRASYRNSAEDAPHTSRSKRQQTQKNQQQLSTSGLFTSMFESYGLKFVAALAVIGLLVLSFLAGTLLRSCAGNTQPDQSVSAEAIQGSSASASASTYSNTIQAPSSATDQSASASSSTNEPEFISQVAALALQKKAEIDAAKEDQENITDILEDDLANELLTQAQSNKDAAWIASNPSEYAFDGWAVQHKILKLAAEEPLARTYVRNWPSEYPATEQNLKTSNAITGTTTGSQNIPQLFQWDPRWGYTVYSSTAFGMTGCCPTALAMVYQGLTGKTDMTPYDMGVLAANDGYMSEYEGTDAYFLINEAAGLGLSCYEIYFAAESIVAALEAGQVLIANVGPGDFTTDGHFIVITGLKDGKLIVNDPYSKVRSDKLWEPRDIIDQSLIIFAYTKA